MISRPGAQAATNNTINFQARLQTSTGSIVPDGYYNVQFKLYDAASAGTNLWTESYIDTNGATAGNDFRVRVQNGYLSVALGSQTGFPTTIDWDQQLWLTMNIGGVTQTATPTYDGEMNPRLALTAVPYAFKAGQLAKQTGSFESTLDFAAQTGSRSILLPDESGTICIRNSTACGFLTGAAANGNYIQNTTTQQTGANFNIQGSGTIGGDLVLGGATVRQGLNDIIGSTGGWFKLGTVTLPQNGSAANIRMYAGSGYNAVDSQNTWVDLMVRTGNGSSTGTNGFGASATAIRYGQGTSFANSIKLKSNVAGATATQFEVYINTGTFPGDGFFTVDTSDGGTWANGLASATDPGAASSSIYTVPMRLDVMNTLSVSSGAVSVTGTITGSNALNITSGGASISGGINNNNGGITNVGALSGVTTLTTTGNISTTGTITASSTATSVFGNGTTGTIQIGDGTVSKTSGNGFNFSSGVNGQAGISTGTGNGTQRIDASGNLVNIGNAGIGGNVTVGGTVSVPNFNSITATNPANTVVNVNSNSLAQSPIGGSLWHDILAFNRYATPAFENYNGTTWSAGTLNSNLFAQKENQAIYVLNGTATTGARWTWNSPSFAFSQGEWLNIGFTYTPTSANKTILFESSADGTSWTTRHTSTGNTQIAQPAWFKLNSYGGDPYIRVTVLSTNAQPVSLSTLRLMTSRWGDQGGGSEMSYPYGWDATQRMAIGANAIVANGVLTVGTNTTTAAGGLYLGTDVNLYRSGASTLMTDDALIVAGATTLQSGLSVTGGVNNNNGGVTNAGAVSGVTTLSASGTLTASSLSLSNGSGGEGNITAADAITGLNDLRLASNGSNTNQVYLATNGRVGIGGVTGPNYMLDVNGDINVALGQVYRANGAAGAAISCGATQFLQNAVVQGGIVTGGTCAVASGGAGVTTVGTIDSQTKNANGAVISGTNIYMQTADATNPGLVSTGAQTFAGAKTFNASVTSPNVYSNNVDAVATGNNLILGGTNATGGIYLQQDSTVASSKNFNILDGTLSVNRSTATGAAALNMTLNSTAANATVNGQLATLNDNATTASSTSVKYAGNFMFNKNGSAADTGYNSGSIFGTANINGGSTPNLWNINSRIQLSTGTSVTNAYDFVADAQYGAGGTVGSRAGFVVNDFNKAVGQTLTTQYGLLVNGLSSATTNYSIYTGSAQSYLGGNVTVAGTLSGNGSGLTTLNATNLSSGTVAPARVAGSYTGITGTGALAAGSIASGFGTISTGNAISTTGTVTGATINATTGYQANGVAGSNATCTGGQLLQNAVVAGGIITGGTCTAIAGDGGVTVVGAIDSQTKSANGAVIAGTSIYLQTADASNPGLVSTGAQTIAGTKTFTGNNAIFRNGTDGTSAFQILNAAGAAVLYVDTTNGSVVISKKTSSFSALEIQGGANSSAIYLANTGTGGSNGLSLNVSASGVGYLVHQGNQSLNIGTNSQNNLVINNVGGATFQNGTNATTGYRFLNAAGNSLLTFDTSNARLMVGGGALNYFPKIHFGDLGTGANNVWIGEQGATDSDALQLQGAGGLFLSTGTSATPVLTLTASGAALFKNISNSVTAFRVQDAGGADVMTVDTTNDVLEIDTPTANVRIGNVFGANYAGITLNSSTAVNDYNILSGTTAKDLYLNRPTGFAMVFRMNNTTQMVLSNNNRLGIGTGFAGGTMPNTTLDVFNSGNTATITRTSSGGGIVAYELAYNGACGTCSAWSFTSSGAIGGNLDLTEMRPLGTTLGTRAYVATGGGGWVNVSDARLKHDVRDVSVLDGINRTRGVMFAWNDSNKVQYGMIAQELQAIFPLAVQNNGQYLGVDYGQVAAIALQGVKEVNAKVDAIGSNLNTGNATIGTLTVTGNAGIRGNLTVMGTFQTARLELAGHFVTKGSAPIVILEAAAGDDTPTAQGETRKPAKVTVKGNDTSGTITIVAGDGASADSLIKLVFNKQFDDAPEVLITPVGKDSAKLGAYIDGTTDKQFYLGAANLPQSQKTYTFNYHVMQAEK